ncbi:1339_t:CDS:2 [Cetraspora pellucida]|uniref:1339_t:CDS:1 n=1 Tax=Cetraspora pellucida TaxID=1433469 RepID=A0A9N9H8E0_9GLOM|nr:1339_t:CDS:2 [Cetraspora pellucida]
MIFSGYEIFNLVATLGIQYLDKFEHAIDYQTTCRVLEIIWIAVEIVLYQYVKDKGNSMHDILKGNNNLIKPSLYLFFSVTVYSMYIIHEEHYLVFDETLKTYSVKFIKQKIFENFTDQKTIIQKIKAAQCERNYPSMLFAEYTDDVVVNQNAHSIQSSMLRINEEGFKKILACYESEKSCLEAILRQDMCKTE